MKKRYFQLINILIISGLFLSLSACAIPSLVVKINTSQDPQARFAGYRTYHWYQPKPESAASAAGQAIYGDLQTHLIKAVEQEIAKKGLQKAENQPQVLLAFDVSLPKTAAAPSQSYPAGFGYGLAWQTGYRYDYGHAHLSNYQPVNAFAPGTILIDVIDASTRQLIWRGWAEAVLEDFHADYKTVANYVDDIIDKYPAKNGHHP
jgi:hypothetical protein